MSGSKIIGKKINILISLFFLAFSGCDTIGRYRVRSEGSFPAGLLVQSRDYSQFFSVPGEKVSLALKITRFNYTYFVDVEISNESEQHLFYESKKVSFNSVLNHASLELKKVSLINELPGAALPEKIVLLGHQKVSVHYEFDGMPVMGFMHIIPTEEQKNLLLKINGLSREKEIPIKISFERI